MRKIHRPHLVCGLVTFVVACSVFSASWDGGILPHIQAHLLGKLSFPLALLLGIPETLVATICTLGVMETFARQWNGSKQFGLRDLFMLTTAVAIAFSFVATDRCLAIKSSDSIVVPPMWVQIAGIFGLACVIYAIALIIEHALKHPEDFSLGKSRKIGRAWTTRSPTGSRHQKKSCP